MAFKLKAGTVTHRNNLDSRCFSGVLVGFHGLTNKFLIGTPNGVERVRTVKRMPAPDRWNSKLLNAFRGLPWKYKDVQSVDDIPQVEYGAHAEPADGAGHGLPSAMGGTYTAVRSRFSKRILKNTATQRRVRDAQQSVMV